MKQVNKRTARVLTVKDSLDGLLRVKHYVEVGGLWYYNGGKSFYLEGLCEPDGFFREPFSVIIKDSAGISLENLRLVYQERTKLSIALRTWTLPNAS